MIIDLGTIRTIDALHSDLERGLKFPSFYNNNWESLRRVLSDDKQQERITLLNYSQFTSRFPAEGKTFSRLIEDYNHRSRRTGSRGRIEVM
ncbi:barstar family protein [Taibaiella chishuiensis]|uniref:Barstar (Barnase inhibitor) n=1 Tax=Taibaiella chishuiensis TaxID=1434707 RepID=A0A2P8D1L0_9BACT|nr:barstar family protein [Taibaiella chishuiensis]PSK91120.1 barstar (barnase inhibitor) [Taibaiella chishuiensis]